jgi:hypothetical protein
VFASEYVLELFQGTLGSGSQLAVSAASAIQEQLHSRKYHQLRWHKINLDLCPECLSLASFGMNTGYCEVRVLFEISCVFLYAVSNLTFSPLAVLW